jgi:hypothetical protein
MGNYSNGVTVRSGGAFAMPGGETGHNGCNRSPFLPPYSAYLHVGYFPVVVQTLRPERLRFIHLIKPRFIPVRFAGGLSAQTFPIEEQFHFRLI